MHPAARALWFIESHLGDALCLDEIASVAGVSRFHLVRAFAAATGTTVMRYVRARRLAEAARSMAESAPDILSVALDAGYNSHEAFTRAFRAEFGTTPETVRAERGIDHLTFQKALRMETTRTDMIEPSRFEERGPFLVAGLQGRYGARSTAEIPGLWQRFHVADGGRLPGRMDEIAYGVMRGDGDEDGFTYLAGVEMSGLSDLPSGFIGMRIPAQRYAVFRHPDHVSAIGRTMSAIWNGWLPSSGHQAAEGPSFERYDGAFDPRTGNGGFEIWIPVAT